MLADVRDDAPELVDIHRFTHAWEKAASLDLRYGHPEAVDAYLIHERVTDGDTEAMIDAAYQAWRDDTDAGKASVLVTDNGKAVVELNARARAERIAAGKIPAGPEVPLIDGTRASVGDWVITRKNDRRLRTLRSGWVRNGDRWTVTDVRDDGSLVVRRQARKRGGAVVLPADYVAEQVDLGYAVTAHRAQGLTVDTAHVVVSDTTTRENLYVAMTRGREHNHAYVIADTADDNHGAPDGEGATAKSVLLGVLTNSGAELSAHQMIKSEQDAWTSIAQLAAEYETIAAAAQRDRWAIADPLLLADTRGGRRRDRVRSLRSTRRGTPTCRSQRPRHRTATPSGRRPIWTRRCRRRRRSAPPPARARHQARQDRTRSTAFQAHRRPHPRSTRPDGTRHASGARRAPQLDRTTRAKPC